MGTNGMRSIPGKGQYEDQQLSLSDFQLGLYSNRYSQPREGNLDIEVNKSGASCRELNGRPFPYQGIALPTELKRRIGGMPGSRIPNLSIKSRVLCQLS